jgi:hypothetical protein
VHRETVQARVKSDKVAPTVTDDVNADDYLNVSELKLTLDKMGVAYPKNADRTKLLTLYESALRGK